MCGLSFISDWFRKSLFREYHSGRWSEKIWFRYRFLIHFLIEKNGFLLVFLLVFSISYTKKRQYEWHRKECDILMKSFSFLLEWINWNGPSKGSQWVIESYLMRNWNEDSIEICSSFAVLPEHFFLFASYSSTCSNGIRSVSLLASFVFN